MSLKTPKFSYWKALCIAPCVFLFLIVFTTPVVKISARNDWQKDDIIKRESEISKAVDPVFINFENQFGYPIYRSAGLPDASIPLDIGDEWVLKYYLEEGKRYHVFLVGDWICNETEPQTDYDIKTTYPDGTTLWNTESAGLPEQVANDDEHQYFVPPLTGTYRFEIINDERDSKDFEPAIFMLLEHIDINTEYSRALEGRDSDGNEVLLSGWAYEIDTLAPKIRVFVDVPDNLDMYEVRLYMMANPDADVGYEISELGVPYGDLFEGFVGEYGGFSTSCKGDRNIDAMDSCETSGRDMEFIYDTPNAAEEEEDEATNNIFYYLVVIAEHEEGTVEFYAQTDFDPPIITLDEPPETGCAGKKTKISAFVEDDSDLGRVWVEYTANGGILGESDSKLEDGVWVCSLSPFDAGDLVEYTVHAEDKFGNTRSVKSDFLVKAENTIACAVNDMSIVGYEEAKITGSSTLNSASLTLKFTNGPTVRDYKITTEEDGSFEFTFLPDELGAWIFQAFYDGSGTEFPAESNLVTFTMKSKMTHISSILSASIVKLDQTVIISGSVSPGVVGLPVEVLLISPSSSSHTETVLTSADGSYSCTFQPTEEGTWSVLSKVGDGFRYASSQSQLVEFAAVPLNIFDKISLAALMLVTPPLLYGTGGMIGVVTVAIVYLKRDQLASLLPKSLANKKGNGKAKGKGRNKGKKNGQRYRRPSKT